MFEMSVAGRLGLSYAIEFHAAEIDFEGETERLPVYWMLELGAVFPKMEARSVFGRLHHRSPAYGLFGDGGGASVLVFGVRYRF